METMALCEDEEEMVEVVVAAKDLWVDVDVSRDIELWDEDVEADDGFREMGWE
jgi:hypothetical protein